MFLQSCDVLASEQQSLVEVIEKLDRQLANPQSRREVLLPHLAYVVEEDEEVVGNLIDRLVELGAMVEEERFSCPDRHHLFTREDRDEAQENGKSLRCPQCRKSLRGETLTSVSVFQVLEEPRYSVTQAGRPSRRVLIVAANPTVERLSLEQEIKRIQAKLTLEKSRIDVSLEIRLAATIGDLRAALLRDSPNVVHFSGHGVKGGLDFEDDAGERHRVKAAGLASFFSTFKSSLDCVVMNACYSEQQAKGIAAHIRYVVGMRGKVPDDAAIEFSTAFYQGLAAGQSFPQCFRLGYSAIQLANLPGHNRPVIWCTSKRFEAGSEPLNG